MLIIVALVLAGASLACNLGGGAGATPTSTPTESPTAPSDAESSTGEDTTAVAEATSAPETEDDTAPTDAPEEADCEADVDATFVTDVTIEDGAEMAAGESFEKTWRIQNNGCDPWPVGTELVHVRADRMGGPASVNVPAADPDVNVDISVNLVAPSEAGEHTSYWRLQTPDGARFGPTVFVTINVVVADTPTPTFTATVTPTVTPTPTKTPAPVTYSTGPITIRQTWSAELDNGSEVTRADGDFWFEAETATDKFLTPLNGATLAIHGTDSASYAECSDASLSEDRIPLEDVPEGTYVCYITDEGRIGSFRMNNIDTSGSSDTLEIGYTTWEIP